MHQAVSDQQVLQLRVESAKGKQGSTNDEKWLPEFHWLPIFHQDLLNGASDLGVNFIE